MIRLFDLGEFKHVQKVRGFVETVYSSELYIYKYYVSIRMNLQTERGIVDKQEQQQQQEVRRWIDAYSRVKGTQVGRQNDEPRVTEAGN